MEQANPVCHNSLRTASQLIQTDHSAGFRLAARFLSGTEAQYEVIRRYAIAFLQKHVAGSKDADNVLEQKDALLTRYIREPLPNKPE